MRFFLFFFMAVAFPILCQAAGQAATIYSEDWVWGVIAGITAVSEERHLAGGSRIFCEPKWPQDINDETQLRANKKLIEKIYVELDLSLAGQKYSEYQYGVPDLPPLPNMVILDVLKKYYPCESKK